MDINMFTEEGKIRTMRCVKATHEDFAKLVKLGRDVRDDIYEMVEKSGVRPREALEKVQSGENFNVNIDGEEKSILWLYGYYLKKQSELDAYNTAYKVLMEEGVDEMLFSIDIEPDSYNYNFYKLCVEH